MRPRSADAHPRGVLGEGRTIGGSAKLRVVGGRKARPVVDDRHAVKRRPLPGGATRRRRPSWRRRRPTCTGRRRARTSAARKRADDAGDGNLRRMRPKRHRSDDVAAPRIEEDDARRLGIVGAGLQEIHERLGRLVSITPSATITCGHRAPRVDLELGSTRKVIVPAAPGRAARREQPGERAPGGEQRRPCLQLVGGDGLEPPTLSV